MRLLRRLWWQYRPLHIRNRRHAARLVSEFGLVEIMATCVHCGKGALRARNDVPLCLDTACLDMERKGGIGS